jgi:hypothetical protein
LESLMTKDAPRAACSRSAAASRSPAYRSARSVGRAPKAARSAIAGAEPSTTVAPARGSTRTIPRVRTSQRRTWGRRAGGSSVPAAPGTVRGGP